MEIRWDFYEARHFLVLMSQKLMKIEQSKGKMQIFTQNSSLF